MPVRQSSSNGSCRASVNRGLAYLSGGYRRDPRSHHRGAGLPIIQSLPHRRKILRNEPAARFRERSTGHRHDDGILGELSRLPVVFVSVAQAAVGVEPLGGAGWRCDREEKSIAGLGGGFTTRVRETVAAPSTVRGRRSDAPERCRTRGSDPPAGRRRPHRSRLRRGGSGCNRARWW